MSYLRVRRERDAALVASRAARNDLSSAVSGLIDVYQAHPVSTLAGAAGIGFVLAQLRVGGGLMRIGARIASGPAWRIVKTLLDARV